MSNEHESQTTGFEVAIIGMTGRFPGAKNIDEYWENLKNGVETMSFFIDDELEEGGVDPDDLDEPNYKKTKSIIEDLEYFDPAFFGYTYMEAEIMAPQIRILHECSWHALEDAGYVPASYDGLIGFYVGATNNVKWQSLIMSSGMRSSSESYNTMQLCDKDHISTRISYKLNLKGPSFTIETQCSTSLVAVHLAYQGLLSGECDIALAGGISITLPKKCGYMHQEGMVESQDGHVRTFDARASGTIFGNGVGLVVLKRFTEAIRDRDNIYAVIKGSAINNDGNRKVGYMAPSVEGQVEVIRAALHMAEVEPETIGYIETHGTGTMLGDPIEIEALTQAFNTTKKQFCKIGSVKGNVGHLADAAGVSGFIKTVLAMKHKLIPPSLHFENPNPKIDFENTPFIVNSKLTEWKNENHPLRAGVSSFGIGGTNSHVILEEAPEGTRGLAPLSNRKHQLILLSARTKSAVDPVTQNLSNHFKKNPGIELSDAAYTLQVGRKAFKNRRALVCSNINEAVAALENPDTGKVHTFRAAEGETPVIFMFSGQGSQYVNMGLDIYRAESSFRADVDRCFDILKDIFGHDLKHILYPAEPVANKNKKEIPSQGGEVKNQIDEMIYSGPIKFVIDYSLARLLMKWGIQPSAMIGHSFGEYVAACLSGVFSLEDALKLVVLRGHLIEKTARGTMMSVPLSEDELKPLLNDEVSLAAVNTPSLCIVSGSLPAVDVIEKELNEKGCECVRLNLSHAGHSKTMDPVLEEFKENVSRTTRNKPRIPYISNVTGNWITAEEAMDPGYYTTHMRRTVRFADGITRLLEKPNAAFIQVGPGRGLALFVEQHPGKTPQNQVINLLRRPRENLSDNYFLLSNIGQLWISGVKIDWSEFYAKEKRRRISLPSYPFDQQWCWKYPDDFLKGVAGTGLKKQKHIRKWFYIPAWRPSQWQYPQPGEFQTRFCWLVFMDEAGLGETLAKRLEQLNQEIIRVNYDFDAAFSKENDRRFTLNPRQDENYDMLFDELGKFKGNLVKVIHLWTLTKDEKNVLEPVWVDRIQDLGFHSLINLAKSIGKQGFENRMTIGVITNHMRQLYDEGFISPGKATITGPVTTIPTEYPDIDCFVIDIAVPEPGTREEGKLVERLLSEFTSKSPDHSIAYRGNKRMLETVVRVELKKSKQSMPRLREEGVYLVIGGLGGVGLVMAEFLAKTVRARLILVGRSPFPAREKWEEWLSTHDKEDDTGSKIARIKQLEEMGARVLVISADVSNQGQMQQVVNRSVEHFGAINGIIHSAVVLDGAMIPRRTRQMTEKIFAPKITGTLVLDKIARGKETDFFVLFSSVAAYFRTLGEVGYCAANAFQDAYAHYKNDRDGVFTLSINWDTWQEVGGAVRTAERFAKAFNMSDAETVTKHGILPKEGIEAFKRVMREDLHQVVVSTRDFGMLLNRLYSKQDKKKDKDEDGIITSPGEIEDAPGKDTLYKRPELSTEFVEPANEIEKMLAQVWQSFFGIEKIGTEDDFFELGGDSLKAMIVVSMIHKKLNIRVPVSRMFTDSTIKEIARYISSDRDGDEKQSKYLSITPVEEKEYYPTSSAQKRMLILNRMKKGHDTSDNTPGVMISDGEMDVQRFEEAAKKLVQRHESFRTSFQLRDDGAIQRIHKNIDFKVNPIDAGNSNPDDGNPINIDESLINHISAKFILPFDLSKAPLFRIGLAKLTEKKHLVLYDMHHIIRDGFSTSIFTSEFIGLYYGNQLPGIRIQYKDFSIWQNKLLHDGAIKKQEEYWLNRFSGELPVLIMPTDYPRPPIHSFEGDFINFMLDPKLVKKVKKMVLETSATLYMVLLTVYNLLLSRYSGQEDIIVGTPIAGRPNVELESIIGMFVNTLAMRNFPKGEMTFKEFLEEVKTNSLKAYENQDYQFEDLVDRLNIKRDQSRHVLFDTMFDTQNFDIKKPEEQEKSNEEIKELNFTRVIFEEKITQFDIILHAYETSDIINFKLRYSTHLFKRESMEMFIDNFKKILTQVVDNAEMKLNDIKISHHLEATEPNIPDVDFKF